MIASAVIRPGIKAVVFDAYGTLFDVHSAVNAHAARIGPEAARFSEIWRQKQLEYSWTLSLAERYWPFWQLTEKALDYAFARFPTVDSALKPLLLDAYRTLAAYPDALSTLKALRRKEMLTGILSNGDTAMLGAALASAGLETALDAVLSVDAARVFKTSPRAYQLILSHFSVTMDEVVFVSSNRWDVAGAAAFGLPTIWVNRQHLPDEYAEFSPRAIVSSLNDLT